MEFLIPVKLNREHVRLLRKVNKKEQITYCAAPKEREELVHWKLLECYSKYWQGSIVDDYFLTELGKCALVKSSAFYK